MRFILIGIVVVIALYIAISNISKVNENTKVESGNENTEASKVVDTTTPDGSSSASEGDSSVLNLSNQNLTQAPSYIFDRTEIHELNLSNNNINGALQAEVRHLQNLRILDLSDNEFTGLPAEVGQLKNLEVLDLSNNQLTGLPHELGNLSKLKTLNLKGNNYSTSDLEIIKTSLSVSTVILVD